jgi:hypothetical protein
MTTTRCDEAGMITKRFFKTKDEVEVTFQAPDWATDSAEVLCETTNWEPIPMRRADRGKGPFRAKIRLPKDTSVQFRYRIDGRWENDEAADDYWANEFGSDNSVVRTDHAA